MSNENLKAKDSSQVEIILLREGSMHGRKGDRVWVDPKTAEALCQMRRNDKGGGNVVNFRVARRADEVIPAAVAGSVTTGEAAELGMRNVVKTPPDDILPKGMRPATQKPEYLDAAVATEEAFGKASHPDMSNEPIENEGPIVNPNAIEPKDHPSSPEQLANEPVAADQVKDPNKEPSVATKVLEGADDVDGTQAGGDAKKEHLIPATDAPRPVGQDKMGVKHVDPKMEKSKDEHATKGVDGQAMNDKAAADRAAAEKNQAQKAAAKGQQGKGGKH